MDLSPLENLFVCNVFSFKVAGQIFCKMNDGTRLYILILMSGLSVDDLSLKSFNLIDLSLNLNAMNGTQQDYDLGLYIIIIIVTFFPLLDIKASQYI